MPERWLADYYDKHAGCHGVLFGKGPSLDGWDLPRLPGEVWMTINEACLPIKGAYYHIMNDRQVLNNLRDAGWKPTGGTVVSIGVPGSIKQPRLRWPGKTIFYSKKDERIFSTGPTSGDGVQVLAAMGVKEILMVGFDGYGKLPERKVYARSIGKIPYTKYQHPREVTEEFRWIRGYIDRAMVKSGVTATFWHQDMEKIRDVRNARAVAG